MNIRGCVPGECLCNLHVTTFVPYYLIQTDIETEIELRIRVKVKIDIDYYTSTRAARNTGSAVILSTRNVFVEYM